MLKNDYSQVREHELKDTQVLVVDLTKKQLDDMRDEEGKVLPISEQVGFLAFTVFVALRDAFLQDLYSNL